MTAIYEDVHKYLIKAARQLTKELFPPISTSNKKRRRSFLAPRQPLLFTTLQRSPSDPSDLSKQENKKLQARILSNIGQRHQCENHFKTALQTYQKAAKEASNSMKPDSNALNNFHNKTIAAFQTAEKKCRGLTRRHSAFSNIVQIFSFRSKKSNYKVKAFEAQKKTLRLGELKKKMLSSTINNILQNQPKHHIIDKLSQCDTLIKTTNTPDFRLTEDTKAQIQGAIQADYQQLVTTWNEAIKQGASEEGTIRSIENKAAALIQINKIIQNMQDTLRLPFNIITKNQQAELGYIIKHAAYLNPKHRISKELTAMLAQANVVAKKAAKLSQTSSSSRAKTPYNNIHEIINEIQLYLHALTSPRPCHTSNTNQQISAKRQKLIKDLQQKINSAGREIRVTKLRRKAILARQAADKRRRRKPHAKRNHKRLTMFAQNAIKQQTHIFQPELPGYISHGGFHQQNHPVSSSNRLSQRRPALA